MDSRSGGMLTFVVFLIVIGGFGLILYNNAQGEEPMRAIVPTQIEPTAVADNWERVLQSGFGASGTAFPTIPIPDQPFTAPTLPPLNETATPVSAASRSEQRLFTLEPISVGASPTLPPPTPEGGNNASGDETANEEENEIEEQFVQEPTFVPQPPIIDQIPLNRDPLGRDHYLFRRPIDSTGFNTSLPSYPYGSTAPQLERIHHGIDMPNPEGTTVRAAAPGTVVFAASADTPTFQNSTAYGNVVAIEHDFYWNGQPVYTIYAHLLSAIVAEGDYVAAGDPIGLNGSTGRVTGAHLHFEVRLGENRYGNTYNPVLWLVPYVGHGTIAGRLVDDRGRFIDDVPITVRNWRTGLAEAAFSTRTYIFDGTVNQVNSDPNWNENFAIRDVPVGTYEIVILYNGERISELVEVKEGRTVLVELTTSGNIVSQPPTPATDDSDGES